MPRVDLALHHSTRHALPEDHRDRRLDCPAIVSGRRVRVHVMRYCERNSPFSTIVHFQYNGKVDIVNRGMGGYNSRQLLSKIRSGFVPSGSSIRLFIIHIGTNDR